MPHGGFHFTYEPDIYVSGVSPTIVPTGGQFEITGSGVCSATGVVVKDSCSSCEHIVPFVTGFGYNGDFCVLTGTLPDITPEAFMTLEVSNTRSTGTFYPFEIVSSAPCIHNCEEVIITGDLTVSGNAGISGTLSVMDLPVDEGRTGFLVVNERGKVYVRHIEPTGGVTGLQPAGIVMIAGSGLLGGGDLTTNRRFDVGQGTGIIVTENAVAVDSGVFVHSGEAWFSVNAGPGLTGDTKVYLGETLDLGVAVDDVTIGFTGASGDQLGVFTVMDEGIGIDKVNFGFAGSNIKSGAANSVRGVLTNGTGIAPLNWSGATDAVIQTSGLFFFVNAGPGLTGDTRVEFGETLDLGVAVDDVTIGFTGVSGDFLGVFTVMDEGIGIDKVNFGFAGSNIKSGAANSVKSPLTAGTGVAPFTYSGLDSKVINLSGIPNAALESGFIYVNAGPGLTGDTVVNLGSTLDLGIRGGSGLLVNTGVNVLLGEGLDFDGNNRISLATGTLNESGFFNVNAGPGLTGDTKVFLGGTLDLGVAVDDVTIGFTGVSGDYLGVFTVMDEGIGIDKVNFGFAGSNIKSGAANSVKSPLTAGTGVAPFTYSGLDSKVINLSGIPNAALESGFIYVNAGPGLTGDTVVNLGSTLDLGVAVDDVTIGFTGVSGDFLGVFTVMDEGIGIDKVNFGFAGSNIKSGAANSVRGYITGGLGIESFVWSGDTNQVLNLEPSGHPYLQNIVYTTGDQTIGGHKTFLGNVNINGLLTATGDGIYVTNLRVTGDVSGILADKTLSISGLNTTDRFTTSEVMSVTPLQSEGVEIFDMEYQAQATGNYLILDTELNLGSKDNVDAIICVFRDSETTPIRAWTHNIYTNNYGQIYNMRYFFQTEDTALHNYKIRVGRRETRGTAPLVYVNRLYSWPTDYPEASGYLGPAAVSSFLITEIRPHPDDSRW